ncbi:MAG: hypothetical protein ITG00_08210 [Flavobacterium sp.]|nr:hypothetical protein [Flavobacterium sp.]
MKSFKYIFVAILAVFISCSPDETPTIADEIDQHTLVQQIENESHIVEMYSATGMLQQGYNLISLRIKDKADSHYVQNASISWMPLMHMTAMEHSCPFSEVTKTIGKETLHHGYIVFQMAENSSEYWTLRVDYEIDGVSYSASDLISVPASPKRRVVSFTGSDGENYIVAMADPINPQVALNAMSAVVYKKQSMMHYLPVQGYTLKIDPRMPSMGNHGSPNNQHLVSGAADLYHGTLSLTMTGYWKINLQLLDANAAVIKGEPVTDTNPESSIFFELEF